MSHLELPKIRQHEIFDADYAQCLRIYLFLTTTLYLLDVLLLFPFFKHSFISIQTLYSSNDINTYFPVQMPTAIPTSHSDHRAVVWELYASNAHGFKVDIPKLCEYTKSAHIN